MSRARKPRERHTLHDALLELERLSGLRLCLYDLNCFTDDSPALHVSSSLRWHTSPVCELMKSRPDTCARCVETQNQRVRESERHPGGFVHTCYAGVTDLVVPLRVHGKHAGALMIGQASVEAPGREREVQAGLARLGFAPEALRKEFARLPRTTPAALRRLGKILALVKGYVEGTEELLALGQEYRFLLSNEAPSAREAIRLGKLPFRRLHQLRSRLHGDAAGPIRAALDAIQSDYAGNLKLEAIAREAKMSVSHFSREFRRQTGFNFRRVVLETRLGAVLFLMKKYGTPIGEAAALVGYADEFSFRRAFRKVSGLSPTAFMKRYPRAFDVVEFS